MSLRYTPSVGEVLECNFGDFPPMEPITSIDDEVILPPPDFDRVMSPEIRKRRMVVVMNGRMPNGCVLVVPISSSGNIDAVNRGIHVALNQELFTVTHFYDERERWALAECITHVSKARLFQIKDRGAPLKTRLPRNIVMDIQKAVIKTISAQNLISKE